MVAASSFAALTAAWACTTCRPAVEAGIFDERFWGRLSITALPFAVVLLVVALLHRSGRIDVPGEERTE
jgi:hypothetical protein